MKTQQRKARVVSDVIPQNIENQRQQNEQKISELQAEVLSLEQRLQQFRNAQSLQSVKSSDSTTPTLDSVTEEIQKLEQLVKENEILTGITISEATCSVLEQDMTSSLRQHAIVGEAGGKQFKLQYDVREQLQKVESGGSEAEVQMLEMDVVHDMVVQLESNLQAVAKAVSVRELLQLLASYGAWVEDRERAINHFASTFPELVKREDSNDEQGSFNMVISDPHRDLQLRVLWELKVLPMQSVVPDLKLQVEASPEVLAKDKKGVMSSAPEIFHLMLKKFGIESAILMLIRLMDRSPT
ncbi:hypothetical protein V1264_021088 [Littorina saxatilis]|uniref:Centromere protein P n=2 Tax=Littorina saxatilis TaxID=31220 RepID=A0AAN9BD89_9CAEN